MFNAVVKERRVHRGGRTRTIALVVTGALVLLVAAAAVVFALRDRADPLAASSASTTGVARGSPGPASTVSPSNVETGAAGLGAAADAVGFRVTAGPDVGLVEALPAEALI